MTTLIKQDEQEATIHGLNHEGRGITHINGKTTFVAYSLPGEQVKFKYHRKHARYDEAIAISIQNPHIDRVTPKCQHFGVCGACSLQHMSTQEQLNHKQKVVLEQLQHFGQVKPQEILPSITGDEYGYRTKARLGVRFVKKKNQLMVGFRELNGRYLADIKQCEVLVPKIGTLINELATLIAGLEAYEHIAQIEVACDKLTHVLIFRNLITLSEADQAALIHFGEKHQLCICLQPGNYETIFALYPKHKILELSYSIPNHDVTIYFHPSDFTQINYAVNLKMIDSALSLLALEPDDKVLDLFCGLGNFSLPIAKYVHHVEAVEGDAAMVNKATQNALRNQIHNVCFHSANLFEKNDDAPWFNQQYDKLLLDPPRTGALELCQQINKFNAKRIVYVSCNPATLARDAQEIIKHGYTLAKVGIVNMFAQTDHIETIALFLKE